MKCAFCGSEMLPGKDRCNNCGKYQHDANRKVEEVNNQNDENTNKKKGHVFISIFKFIVFLGIVSVIVYFVLNYLESQKAFYGKWRCSNGEFILTIDKKNFEMDYGSNGSFESEYMLDKEVIEDNKKRYSLDVSSTKKLKNGDQYTDANLTKFDIVMEDGIDGKLTLENTIKGESYVCYKSTE